MAEAPPPGLLALDLDGTLLTSGNVLPPGHATAVEAVRALGIPVMIVTGRPLLSARWIHTRLALDTPMVCFNGVWVGHPDGPVIAMRPLTDTQVHEAIAAIGDEPVTICCYPRPDAWLMDRVIPRTEGWSERYGVPITVDHAAVHGFTGTSCKIMVVGEPADLTRIEPRVRTALGDRMHVSFSQNDRFEIIAPGASKAWGLERAAAALGVPRRAVWAVGDALNDREMLTWAGTACVMGQAPATLQEEADHVLPSIETEGLTAVVALLRAAPGTDWTYGLAQK